MSWFLSTLLGWPKKKRSARVVDEAAAAEITLAPRGDHAAAAGRASISHGAYGGGGGGGKGGFSTILAMAFAPLTVASCFVCQVEDVDAVAFHRAAEMEDLMAAGRIQFAIFL